MIHALLVDDEPRARRALRTLLQQHYADHISIVAEANNADEARKAVLQYAPDVLFLDIHMPGEDGLQLLASIHPKHRLFLTIFVTAYNQYVLRAMRERALDYLTKPIDLDEFHATMGKLQSEIQAHKKLQLLHDDKIDSLLQRLLQDEKQEELPSYIVIYTNKQAQQTVELVNITHCRSERNYCRVFLKDGTSIVSSKSLGEYEPLLLHCGFVRLHRSYLVSLASIERYILPVNARTGGTVVLRDGTRIDVARRKKHEMQTMMQNNAIQHGS